MYGYKKEFNGSFGQACKKAVEELKKEGFGVLTEIDVKKTLKEKINEDFPEYKIFGVCNPFFALKALKTEKEIGLLMPCNVIVFEEKGKIFVSALLPTKAMQITNNSGLREISLEAERKLKKAIKGIKK
jgi:uncharacterized protein (DUF302 family)